MSQGFDLIQYFISKSENGFLQSVYTYIACQYQLTEIAYLYTIKLGVRIRTVIPLALIDKTTNGAKKEHATLSSISSKS